MSMFEYLYISPWLLFTVIKKHVFLQTRGRLLILAVPVPVLARQWLLSSTLLPIVENGIACSVPGGLVPVMVKVKDHMKPPAVFDEGFGCDADALACLEQSTCGVTRMGAG